MKVAISSFRKFRRDIFRANSYEFEDIACAVSGADRIDVLPPPPSPSNRLQYLADRSMDRMPFEFHWKERLPEVRVREDYDLFVARILTLTDLTFLSAIKGWRERCGTGIIWIEELWPQMLAFERMFQPLKEFDHIFVSNHFVIEPLEKITGRPVSYLPFAVDALSFSPVADGPDRTIDFMALGRRSNVTHESLLRRAKEDPGFHYVYDSAQMKSFRSDRDHTDHRFFTASMIQRSKFFLADKAHADMPAKTGGNEVYGPRFFEGAAGGAILIGEPPDCEGFRQHFDWPDAIVALMHGAEDPFPVMEAFVADKDRVLRARKNNVANMLTRHDWLHRWLTILETVNAKPTSASEARRAKLNDKSEAIRRHL